MVAAFADRDLPLFAAYYRRALPRFIKVKQLLDAGALGRLHTVRFHYASDNQAAAGNPVAWRFLAEHAGGGLFMDMGPHPVDLFDFWFGPLKITQASAGNKARAYAVEDHIRAQFTAPGLAEHGVRGIEGAMTLDFAAAPADAFLLAGDAAELRFSCFGNEPLRLRHADGRSETFDLPNPPHVAQPLIQTVVNALRGTGECPGTAASALRAQQVMDDILNDYYGGREDHFWTRPWPGVSPKG